MGSSASKFTSSTRALSTKSPDEAVVSILPVDHVVVRDLPSCTSSFQAPLHGGNETATSVCVPSCTPVHNELLPPLGVEEATTGSQQHVRLGPPAVSTAAEDGIQRTNTDLPLGTPTQPQDRRRGSSLGAQASRGANPVLAKRQPFPSAAEIVATSGGLPEEGNMMSASALVHRCTVNSLSLSTMPTFSVNRWSHHENPLIEEELLFESSSVLKSVSSRKRSDTTPSSEEVMGVRSQKHSFPSGGSAPSVGDNSNSAIVDTASSTAEDPHLVMTNFDSSWGTSEAASLANRSF